MEHPEESSGEERVGPTMEHLEDSDDEERAGPTREHPDDTDDEKRLGYSDGYEIVDLLWPMYSGMKDLVPPLPLLFDRVSEGRKPVSGTKLLEIPLEVLALIVQKIPEVSLVCSCQQRLPTACPLSPIHKPPF